MQTRPSPGQCACSDRVCSQVLRDNNCGAMGEAVWIVGHGLGAAFAEALFFNVRDGREPPSGRGVAWRLTRGAAACRVCAADGE
jgi:hypothetical protein